MALFGKYGAADSATPPFTKERWDGILTSLDIKFATDDDNDRFGDWDDMRIWFMVEGQNNDLMAIRSLWDVRPPAADFERLVVAANEWNAGHFWPKASVSQSNERCMLFGDLVIDIETGATDDFLRQQVRCMVGTSGQLFEFFTEKFPESKGWFNIGA